MPPKVYSFLCLTCLQMSYPNRGMPMLLSTLTDALLQGNQGWELTELISWGRAGMRSRWRSTSVPSTELARETVTSQRGLPLHCHHGCCQQPSPASSLRLIWVPAETTSPHSCLPWIPSQIHSAPFVSKEHRVSTPFFICPHNSLTAHQVYTVCRCGKGGRKSLTIYKQSSSPILSSLHPIGTPHPFFFFGVLNLYQALYFA